MMYIYKTQISYREVIELITGKIQEEKLKKGENKCTSTEL